MLIVDCGDLKPNLFELKLLVPFVEKKSDFLFTSGDVTKLYNLLPSYVLYIADCMLFLGSISFFGKAVFGLVGLLLRLMRSLLTLFPCTSILSAGFVYSIFFKNYIGSFKFSKLIFLSLLF